MSKNETMTPTKIINGMFAAACGLILSALLWFVLYSKVIGPIGERIPALPYLWDFIYITPIVSVFVAGLIASLLSKEPFTTLLVGMTSGVAYGWLYYGAIWSFHLSIFGLVVGVILLVVSGCCGHLVGVKHLDITRH